jgi:hypothetical protein
VIRDQPPTNSKEFVQMTSKKHRMMIYGVAAHLFLIAIVCYAAFPVEKPEEPLRLMYHTKAGKVLFDHKIHAGEEGYGLDCYDCHHHTPDDETGLISCGTCHVPKPEQGVHPESCLDCHEEDELEDSEYPKHSDALHDQCTNCHNAYGSGPMYQNSLSEEEKEALKKAPNPWVDCNKCHVI